MVEYKSRRPRMQSVLDYRIRSPVFICLILFSLIYLWGPLNDDEVSLDFRNKKFSNDIPVKNKAFAKRESLEPDLSEVYNVARRNVPLDDFELIEFHFDANAAAQKNEYFEWYIDVKAHIKGSTLSALTKGLADLYEVHCGVTLLSWADASTPTRPCLSAKRDKDSSSSSSPTSNRVTSTFPIRYGWNAVTFSYTTAYWDWERYERELDWLALRGVNLLLAHEGQEAIMARVFRELYGSEKTYSFFTHQAYFAWNRMGNIHGLGGPPSQAYMESRLSLQHKILSRMNRLGMSPILFGFNGFVPQQVPESKCESKLWSGFSRAQSSVCRVSNMETLYEISRRMVQEQINEYGQYLDPDNVVYFSSDMFNENPVSQSDEIVLSALGQAVYQAHNVPVRSMGFSRGAKLVLQMWFFANDFEYWTPARSRHFLQSFPPNSLVLLDLHAEKRSQAVRLGLSREWAKETKQIIVFCVLHNFGGGGGIAGEVQSALKKLDEMLQSGRGAVQGIGFAPEALEQNEVVYDSILGYNWINHGENNKFSEREHHLFHVGQWMTRRYRLEDVFLVRKASLILQQAWRMVMENAYERSPRLSGFGPTKSVWEIRPFPGMMIRGKFMPTMFSYNANLFFKAVHLFIQALDADEMSSSILRQSNAFWHDLVDFARQALSDLALEIVIRLQRAHFEDDDVEFTKLSQQMLKLLETVGSLLSSHPDFCFVDIDPSKLHTDVETRRQLLTQWHESNNGMLADYGSKQLGGSLFSQVHLKRWQFLLESKMHFEMASFQLEVEFKSIERKWFKSNVVGGIDQECSSKVDEQKILQIVKQQVIEYGIWMNQVLGSDDKKFGILSEKRSVPVFGGANSGYSDSDEYHESIVQQQQEQQEEEEDHSIEEEEENGWGHVLLNN